MSADGIDPLHDEIASRVARARRFRMLVPAVVVYFVIAIIISATLVAYPELFSDNRAMQEFVRENYGNLVGIVAVAGATATVLYLSPGSLRRIAEFLLPTMLRRVFVPDETYKSSISESVEPLYARVRELEAALSSIALSKSRLSVAQESRIEREKLDKELDEFSSRMSSDQARLNRNSRINLAWGVFFSIGALAVLGYPVVIGDSYDPATWRSLVGHLAPRTALGVLFALISFFFLRLYAGSEQDLKHHKNEITNFESRIIAAKISIESGDKKMIFEVVRSLSNVERNFIIKKDEKTVSGEYDDKFNQIGHLVVEALKVARPPLEKT